MLSRFTVALLFSLLPLTSPGQEAVTTGHYDLSLSYEPGQGGWVTGIFDYINNRVLAEDAIVFAIDANGLGTIPAGEPWSVMGPEGSPVWILPEVYDASRVYLGFGTQNMPRGIFTGGLSNRGRIDIQLVSVSGSGVEAGGTLTMWQAGFPPLVHYATGDGIDENDALRDVPAGAHSHYNWAFTQPGYYNVTFEVSGELTAAYGGGEVSTRVTYRFHVAGERPEILDGVESGGGWFWSPVLGFFTDDSYPWVYFETQGWWCLVPGEADDAYIWDSQLGWLWVSASQYPNVYAFERENWLLYSNTADGLRWFFQYGADWFHVPQS